MSFRPEQLASLAGINYAEKTAAETHQLFLDVLKSGMHGLCFSAYTEGQEPGDVLTESQIRKRMEVISPYTEWIRSFSCIEGNELIPKIAKEYGLKTLVGAWLGKDDQVNQQEVESLIQLSKEGLVDIASVGNEVLYRKDLTEEQLLKYMYQVKHAVNDVPVGYVDAYYEFSDRPKVTEACDVILANCYPYWEACHNDYSLVYMKQMFQEAVKAGKGKKVIVTETGWPSHGTNLRDAHPSKENALKYFINAQVWSKQEEIDLFYFTSFDESWKVGDEGDVGAYWGLWDKNHELKF